MLSVAMPITELPAYAAADTQTKATLASAYGRVYAIKEDGSLWYWGKNTFNNSAGDQSPLRASPCLMMDDVIGVYAAWNSGFAIKSDNSLWAIDDCRDTDGNIYKGTDPPIKLMDGVIGAACSYTSWVALKSDGTAWYWSYEQDAIHSIKPKLKLSDVKQVSAAIDSYYALKNDGSLWGWGYNSVGELGVKTDDSRIAAPIKMMDGVKSLYASGQSAYVIKDDDSLWGWGGQYDGLILNGKNEEHTFSYNKGGTESAIFTPVKMMDDVKKIDGRNHLCVIKNDNSLWVWGRNDKGELGNGTTKTNYTPAKLADNVVDVTAKGDFTVFLKDDGTLWGCGSNVVGELGLGAYDNDPHTVPVKIMDGVMLPNNETPKPTPIVGRITVTLNGAPIVFDISPIIQQNRVLVPMRAIFEVLGANVYWIGEGQEIIAFKGENLIEMKIGEKSFYILDLSGFKTFDDFSNAANDPKFDFKNISKEFTFDATPQITDGRTLIPVRAISEAFGISVGWDDKSSTAILSCGYDIIATKNRDQDFIDRLVSFVKDSYNNHSRDDAHNKMYL